MSGNGNIHKNLFPILEKAAKDGVVVVRSSRVPTGSATKDAEIDDAKYGFVAGSIPQPAKSSRVVAIGFDEDQRSEEDSRILSTNTREYFDKY